MLLLVLFCFVARFHVLVIIVAYKRHKKEYKRDFGFGEWNERGESSQAITMIATTTAVRNQKKRASPNDALREGCIPTLVMLSPQSIQGVPVILFSVNSERTSRWPSGMVLVCPQPMKQNKIKQESLTDRCFVGS
jgi:hypothetical protein